jgi:two-component system sensor histidine kinase and response regulator WspE
MTNPDMSNFSMLDLFRMEVETQAAILSENLLALESNPNAVTELESLMRAAHSIKGAARIVQLESVVNIAHVMEDCFVAAQQGAITINSANKIDVLLRGTDMLLRLSQLTESEIEHWLKEQQVEIETLITAISAILQPQILENSPQKLEGTIDSFPISTENFSSDLSPQSIGLWDISMLELFRQEVEKQAVVLTDSLQALKSDPNFTNTQLDSPIQAAHLIQGAALIVQISVAVRVAQAIEGCFISVQSRKITLDENRINTLYQGVDLLLQSARIPPSELDSWQAQNQTEIENTIAKISTFLARRKEDKQLEQERQEKQAERNQNNGEVLSAISPSPALSLSPSPTLLLSSSASSPPSTERVVRVSADNLNRIMGLAGESLVEANWLQLFANSLIRLKKTQVELSNILERLNNSNSELNLNKGHDQMFNAARQKAGECQQLLSERLNELEVFARRSANLSDRLYREVIASNMRPFADGVQGFPRMLRDLARRLGKQVKFEINGKSTEVDRDILEKLEAPLTHILRNAIDHGIETPQDRLSAGKPPEGTVVLAACHRAGMLSITVSDDGRGIDLEQLRQKIISNGMINAEMAAQLSESELLEFLFLPGFSTAKTVTEFSGRGVGLDVVQSMVHQVGGILRATSQPGKGMTIHLQLPLTLSVIRTLLVEISGEPYAFPLTRIDRIVMIRRSEIAVLENRHYFKLEEQNIGLVDAYKILELKGSADNLEELPTIIISDRLTRYGLIVDRFLGERDLVVKPLDPRLGKVPDISAVALMEDGSPVLIVDVEDMIRSIDKLLNNGWISQVGNSTNEKISKHHKHILVVDDSITVREVERKLLENQGYNVEVAVNGMDGWNAVRTGHYDLVITDIDMPRMNGIELVRQIKNHPDLKSLPVMIVSYKDREEDRIQGLEVGADYYLTKTCFHDDSFLKAVIDLIGEE